MKDTEEYFKMEKEKEAMKRNFQVRYGNILKEQMLNSQKKRNKNQMTYDELMQNKV